MLSSPEELSPLAAYEELMRFAQKCGEATLRLALHASVPQGFQPDLLHLLKRNFVPEAGDDPTTEVDTLFSPICEDLGRGYFRFHPHVRTLLLDNLASNYAGEPKSRIRRVANFLLFYVDRFDRSTTENQDQLWRDYLEMQRWVAFAFLSPEAAARQLAAALENATSSQNFAARMQLGGLASALATPLVGYRSLLNYAAGLQALELGNQREAEELFAALTEHDLKVGDTVLRPASKLIEEWQNRNRGVSSQQPATAEEVIVPEESAAPPPSTFAEAIVHLTNAEADVRRRGAEFLGHVDAPVVAVPALVATFNDPDRTLGLAAIRALAVIGTEAAVLALTDVAQDGRNDLRVEATAALASMRKGAVLILGRLEPKREEVLEAIRESLRRHNYVPLFLGTLDESEFAAILSYAKFIIADITEPRRVRSQLKAILPLLKIPVQPIVQGRSRIYETFSELQHYSSLLKPHRYDGVSDLLSDLTQRVIPSLSSWVAEVGGRERPSTASRALSSVFADEIFINYSHEDNAPLIANSKGWVDILHESLATRLTQIIGEKPRIWRDPLFAGKESLGDTITVRLSNSAVFICILSPSSLKSRWCLKELVEFYERAGETGGIKFNNRSRIFKVVKSPIDERDLLEADLPSGLLSLLQESLGYEFFEYDRLSGKLREFWPEFGLEYQKKFLERLEDLAHDIKDFMTSRTISKGVEEPSVKQFDSVYLAETTPNLSEERYELRRTLQVNGYRVLPDMTLPFDEFEFEERVREYLSQSSLSIHLIGSDHDASNDPDRSFQYQFAAKRIRLQHELALERGNRDADFLRLLWIPAGLSAQNASYREFISYLQNDPSVYEGAEVLSGTNLEDLKTVIQKRLVDQRQKLEPVSEGRRVYLICDKQDLQAVGPIRDYLFAEGFEVILPFKGEAQGLSGHRENLRVCDAVLIFYGTANTVDYKLMELRRMDVLRDSRPLLAKGIYVGGPETDHKRVFTTSEAIVIKNFGEFTPESLKPFIEQFAETPKAKPF